MLAVDSEVWLPLVTLAIGYAFSLITEWSRDGRAMRRDRQRWLTEFQRDTILRLQDSTNDLLRASGEAYGLRIGQDGRPQLPQDLRSRVLDGEQIVRVLASRVTNMGVRRRAENLCEATDMVCFGPTFKAADDAFATVRVLAQEIINETGLLVRAGLA